MAALCVSLAAFLLFIIQPLAAKTLLPIFGGAASVWTACLLFFQAALLAGYAWAHYARPSWHLVLLAAALGSAFWAPPLEAASVSNHPSLDILRVLGAGIGLPYVTLAATSPLIQRLSTSRTPYRLYALSNAVSIPALIAYPILIEPFTSIESQWSGWRWLLVPFFILCAATLIRSPRFVASSASHTGFDPLWIALPAAGVALLMATTAQMCQEIASIPFLWIVPLAVYLLTFVLAFDHPRWYVRRVFTFLAAIAIPGACVLYVVGINVPLRVHLIVYPITLFACLMLCHGELALRCPSQGGLTRYYLAMASGGAVGGVFAAFLAPKLFTSYAEFPISLGAAAALGLWAQVSESGYRGLAVAQRASFIGLIFAVMIPLATAGATAPRNVLVERRNFYGILRVTEGEGKRTLTHGAITHGTQFLEPHRRRAPTTYYGWQSGAGSAFQDYPGLTRGPIRAGFIGLGAGTLARYGRPGDQFRFYELNPDVIEIARSQFTFLADSQASTTVVEGDARLRLTGEPPQRFDLLMVDAFSSDSIPVHLLTAECSEIYRRHMAPGGWLLFHISNHTLNLEPVVRAIAARLNWAATKVSSSRDVQQGTESATWVILDSSRPYPPHGPTLSWTDSFAAVWSVLK
jgi:hypothetical protein